jgi:tRNA nucleotidyltransferase/poly(A) polymerase
LKLRQLFTVIDKIGKDNSIPNIYLCGGAVRDRILGTLDKLEDIDLTTGGADVKNLAVEISRELSKSFAIESKQMEDGHTSIFLENIKIDLSSNFIDPAVDSILKQKGISNPTDIQKEMFSRDFTVNSLLMSLDLKKGFDPTGMGQKDIKNKFLRTCLPPEITLKSNVNRIIRVIYMAAKLGFTVDPLIIKYISENKNLISEIAPGYLSKTLTKAVKYNTEKTVELLDAMGLWKALPITEPLYPYYAKRFIKAASSTQPSHKDLMDALDHADTYKDEEFSLKDFSLKFEGNLSPKELLKFDSLDWMDLDPRATSHDPEELDNFRGKDWITRARTWEKTGIPPIVVITAPDLHENGKLFTQIGDGRGRVNFAALTGMKLPTWHLIYNKPIKTAQLKKNFDYGEGFYSNLQEQKSVSDFRRKRKKQRKKTLKQIRDMKLK